jgi:hypothetical protein
VIALTTLYMRWWPIALAIVVPTIAGLIVARLFWRRDSTVGNIVGSAVIAAAMIGFISREYADLANERRSCVDRDVSCVFRPSDFSRYAIFASIGFVEVMLIYSAGLRHEERLRRRDYSPEWR